MSVNLAYCHDCHALDYAAQNNNGSFTFTPQASAHFNHTTHHFGAPDDYPAPIRLALIKLGAGVEMTNNDITMMRLGLELDDRFHTEATCPPAPSTAPAAANTSPTSPAPALASAASTRSLPVSPPTPTTPAPGEQLGLDFGEGA